MVISDRRQRKEKHDILHSAIHVDAVEHILSREEGFTSTYYAYRYGWQMGFSFAGY